MCSKRILTLTVIYLTTHIISVNIIWPVLTFWFIDLNTNSTQRGLKKVSQRKQMKENVIYGNTQHITKANLGLMINDISTVWNKNRESKLISIRLYYYMKRFENIKVSHTTKHTLNKYQKIPKITGNFKKSEIYKTNCDNCNAKYCGQCRKGI